MIIREQPRQPGESKFYIALNPPPTDQFYRVRDCAMIDRDKE